MRIILHKKHSPFFFHFISSQAFIRTFTILLIVNVLIIYNNNIKKNRHINNPKSKVIENFIKLSAFISSDSFFYFKLRASINVEILCKKPMDHSQTVDLKKILSLQKSFSYWKSQTYFKQSKTFMRQLICIIHKKKYFMRL